MLIPYDTTRQYQKTPFITVGLVVMNVGVALWFALIPLSSKEVMLYDLALIPEQFNPVALLTSMFMHAGFWHLFANMLTLFFFGSYFYQLVGTGRFLAVYFGGGILGNILYLLLGEPISIMVGASGAVFALGGALAIMRPKLRVFIFPIPIPMPLWVAVIGGFLIISFFPNVAWQAHLGGLIFGLIAGYFFRRRERRFFMMFRQR